MIEWTKLDLDPEVEAHEATIGDTRWRAVQHSRGWSLSRRPVDGSARWRVLRALDREILQWPTLREACAAAERVSFS